MTERVEEIRRAHAAEEYYCGLIGTKYQDVIGHLLTALAQAEREREQARLAVLDLQNRFDRDREKRQRAEDELMLARTEVERLKEYEAAMQQESTLDASRAKITDYWKDRAEQAEAALARVRAALGITTDGLRELERHFSDTAYPVSTMEHELVLMSPLQKIQDVLKRAALEGRG